MTKKQQVKKDAPKAVELNQAALDRAVGGGLLFTPLPRPVRLTSSDGADKSISRDINDFYI